jgi:hypothetical protein
MIAEKQMNLGDNVKGTIQVDNYSNDNFSLFGYNLTTVLDDIILVEFLDVHDDEGGYVDKDGIIVPVNILEQVWRIARVLLTGPNCQHVKEGDIVTFPNDKGLKLNNVTIENEAGEQKTIKNGTFLNEARIFGTCTPTEG